VPLAQGPLDGRGVTRTVFEIVGVPPGTLSAAHASVPYHPLSLVVVTDRWDRAGKHSQEEVVAKVQKAPADVYVIGIGESVNREDLELVGKSGAFFAEKPKDIPKPFVDVATKIDANLGQDYLFAYCSPQKTGARPGKHVVEVKIASSHGKATVAHEFSTKGFTDATCDPKKKPEFGAAAEKLQSNAADEAGDDDAGESKKAHGGKKKAKRTEEEADE